MTTTMNKLLTSAMAGLALSFGSMMAVPDIAEAKIPMEVYAELPRTSQVRVSPNGKRVALIAPYKDDKAIFIYDLANPESEVVIPMPGTALLKTVAWGSDNHVLALAQFKRIKRGRAGSTYTRYVSTNLSTGKQVIMMEDKVFEKTSSGSRVAARSGGSQGGSFVHALPNDPDHVLMGWLEWAGDAFFRHYKVNLNTGDSSLVRSMPIETTSAVLSKTGDAVLARAEYSRRKNLYSIYTGDGSKTGQKPIFTQAVPEGRNPWHSLVTVLKDNGKLLVAEGEQEKLTLFTLDLATGARAPYRLSVDAVIPDGYSYTPIVDPYTDALIGVSWIDDYSRSEYSAEPYRSWARKAKKAFPGKSVRILSRTRDNQAVTLLVSSPGAPGEYYLYEPAAKRISPLGGSYPEIKATDVAKTVRTDFTARDGKKIPAYLTLPPGKTMSSGAMPLVVMPHGGPIGVRDDAEFDWWAQHIANQGYAVFKPQFRGSGGFGYNYVKAGYGEFGEAMLEDTIDGVKSLISKGVVDKNKICVTGASYGGYQAFALPVMEPDMFKCALALNGVSDIKDIMKYEIDRGGPQGGPIKFWNRVIGDYYDDRERIEDQSPANHAEKIKAEVVILHGTDDYTVPYDQSKIMSRALKKAGQNSPVIVLDKDDHFLSRAESRRKLLKESDNLFAKHLK